MLRLVLIILWNAFVLNLALRPPNSSFANLSALDEVLLLPIENVPHLTIMLRSTNVSKDATNMYVRWFLERSPCPLTIGIYQEADDTFGTPQLDENRDSFAVVTNMKHLHAVAKRFVQRAGTFFFILSDAVVEGELLATWSSMWNQYNVYQNYLLTEDAVLIYDPFQFDVQRQTYGKIVRYMGKESLERILFHDMRGYPLRIQIFKSVYARPVVDRATKKLLKIEGVDWKVAKLLQQRMNFSMILQDPDPDYFGERDANGTYNGVIGSIIKNEVDACFTGFFVKDYMVPEMDFTVAVYDDKLCIYAHKADRIPQSILPIFSVRFDLWLGFILTAFICAGIWCSIRGINLWLAIANVDDSVYPRKSLGMQFTTICVDTWVVWVRVNVVRYPPFNSERVFIASLCLVSVIFGAIFESSLATVYIHPMYYSDIHTMRELDESGLKIAYKFTSMADDLFFSETSPLYASLNKKLTHISDLNADVMLDVAENGGKAGVSRYISLMMDSFHYILAKKVWVIPECPKYYTISYVMPKDAPWEETINALLLRFLNAGLIKKWMVEMQTAVDIRVKKKHAEESDTTFKVLTVANLQLAFYVVIAGNIWAFVIFFGELYLGNMLQKTAKTVR